MRSHSRACAARGFTLIELLVVVAIIALLISILLPSLNNARRQAKQVLDLTNLRSQGSAAVFYADEHKGWMGAGIQGYWAKNEYNIYALTVVKGLGYDFDTRGLFTGQSGLNQKKLRRTLIQVAQFQCTEDPVPKSLEETASIDNPNPEFNQVMDFIASAAPIPYDRQTFMQDAAGLGQAPDQPRVEGLEVAGYLECRRQDAVAAATNPAALVYVTEGSVYLSDTEMRYHHFFVASQLPFSANPRIARDQRHPGGIANLFFDGHAEMLQLQQFDAGWGESLGKRMKYITVPAADITEAEWNG